MSRAAGMSVAAFGAMFSSPVREDSFPTAAAREVRPMVDATHCCANGRAKGIALPAKCWACEAVAAGLVD